MERAEEIAKQLKGIDVIITGVLLDGRRFKGRRINNVTLLHANGAWWVHGFDPKVKQVRKFRWVVDGGANPEVGFISEMVAADAMAAGAKRRAS